MSIQWILAILGVIAVAVTFAWSWLECMATAPDEKRADIAFTVFGFAVVFTLAMIAAAFMGRDN